MTNQPNLSKPQNLSSSKKDQSPDRWGKLQHDPHASPFRDDAYNRKPGSTYVTDSEKTFPTQTLGVAPTEPPKKAPVHNHAFPTNTPTLTPSPPKSTTPPGRSPGENATPAAITTSKKTIAKESLPRIHAQQLQTIREYILKLAPSKSYELVYSKVLSRTRNKRGARGKKVYPYGQHHAAELTGLSPRTIRRTWAWLRRHGIFNKAWNENPDLHHNSGWYVCTSMKQVAYFRDPKNRHRKTKR